MNPEIDTRAAGLRAWAAGMYTLSAAAELLIRSGSSLLTGPWVEYDPERDRYWFNTESVADHEGYLSGGERRMLNIAAALANDEHHVGLGDAVSGIDRGNLAFVLAAIAHAAGSHEHSRMIADDDGTPVRFEKQGSLYPWPEQS